MSNTLIVTVTEFKTLATGEVEYGYTAGDNEASTWEAGWKSLDDFKADFPTPEVLGEYVKNKDEFFGYEGDAYVEWPASAG